ncbi:MAG: hypothetical protein NTX88_00585 [Candidatus Atribacteria bacterium]|nr:hypothetical protein [Candidatus Atribacteria bacterium]
MISTSLSPQFGYKLKNGNTLFKGCQESRHFLRVPGGIAIDADVFDEAIVQGTQFIQIFGKESRTYFTISTKDFKARCFEFNRKFGRQYAVQLDRWTTSKSAVIPKSLTVAPPIKKSPSQQLPLFAGCKR